MMDIRRRRGAAAAAVAGIVGLILWWRSGGQDFEADHRRDYVRNLEIAVEGGSLPDVIHRSQLYPLRLRFENSSESAAAAESHMAIFTVVGPRGHAPKSVDAFEAILQQPGSEKGGPKLPVMQDGQLRDLTPPPPKPGEPFLQYCAMLAPRMLVNSVSGDSPLELQLWLYPQRPQAAGGLGTGVLVYRHSFRLEGE